ncbi:MAG: ABC transporter permease [Oscillospiraceae bacterium]|nr:ABC transporter permease [Oscillospiraceae bacterium]
MFKTIFGLAFEGIKRRKRQSLLIFAVLLVSFTFAIVIICYSSSISATNSQLRADTYGTWYGAITSGVDTDREYLESSEWLYELSASVNYGTAYNDVQGLHYGSSSTIGTVDSSFEDMGIVVDGRLPQSSGEIAIEEATLSSLQYGATLGQTIYISKTITDDNGETQEVTKEFTLVGIISEYTRLWGVNCTLNNIIVTEEDMLAYYTEAGASMSSIETETAYFFTVKSGYGDTVETEINKYLWDSREGTNVRVVTINFAVELENEAEAVNTFYIWLILAITLLAVVMIYILQMQSEVRRIVRFRSIGASKGQLRLLIFLETMILCIPAMIMGVLFGALGIRAVLALSVYSGSVDIAVSIPWNYLALVVTFWIIGVLAVRLLTFQVALATPLTGRMGMQTNKNKLFKNFRSALIMLMATMLCVSVVFSAINIAEPLSEYNYWTSRWSYYVVIRGRYNNDENTMSSEDIALISEVPGVSDVVNATQFQSLVTDENGTIQQATVFIMDSDDVKKFVSTKGIDMTAYENGESVIIQIASDGDAVASEVGSDVTVSIDYDYLSSPFTSSHDTYTAEDEFLTEDNLNSTGLVNVTSTVGSSQVVERSEILPYKIECYEYGYTGSTFDDSDYFIIASKAFLQNILVQIPEDKVWNLRTMQCYHGQSDGDYWETYIYTDSTANGLATDTVLENLITELGGDRYPYTLKNMREINEANAQVYLQSIIMTIVTGVCIALVVLMILVSTLRLETESEKRRYGILQAIGMSRRQRNIELGRRAAIRSTIAISVAVVSYLVYYLMANFQTVVAGTSPIAVLSTMFTTLAEYGLTAPVLLLILLAVFLLTFVICFGSKLSLNRYTLMEMLREDR